MTTAEDNGGVYDNGGYDSGADYNWNEGYDSYSENQW